MMEFNFSGCWDDALDILRAITINDRYTFIIDKPYIDEPPLEFSQIDEVISQELSGYNHLFIWSSLFSLYPPVFEDIGKYKKIYLPRCGPMLDLLLPISDISKGKLNLGNGWLICPTIFRHPQTDVSYKPNLEIKKAFRYIKRIIKGFMEKRYISSQKIVSHGLLKPSIEEVWIGKKGYSLFMSGQAGLILGYDSWVEPADLVSDPKRIVVSSREKDKSRL